MAAASTAEQREAASDGTQLPLRVLEDRLCAVVVVTDLTGDGVAQLVDVPTALCTVCKVRSTCPTRVCVAAGALYHF